MNNIPTPHITANKGDFAKTVIMPGDPLRAKFIAEEYLEDVVEINNIRNMLAYTGSYKGRIISVMGSGMGLASIGIYAYELFKFYDVENIIRIGSAGGLCEDLNLYDVVLATSAHTSSNYGMNAFDLDEDTLEPSLSLNKMILETAKELNIKLVEGKLETSDAFYKTTSERFKSTMKKEGCIASEMEAYALFATAKVCNKNAACLVTISGHMIKRQSISAIKRETSFIEMIEIALNIKC